MLNGLNLGPLHVASIDGDMLTALNSKTLAASGETMGDVDRQVLAYAYSCAMPASSSMELDIGGERWRFQGAVGLAPQWETAACDQDCQEWVSACILARTNQFGTPVELSLRGQHDALSVPPDVASEFTLREGSFYGNIFTASDSIAGDAYACAGGRGSAIWELTSRFCSALGDGCPIKTVADCNINEFACDVTNPACSSYTACSTWDASGHPTTCYSEFHLCGQAPAGTAYNRVITTYLKAPSPSCGNGICEDGEAETCAADCANHWANRYGSGCHEDAGGLSLDEAGNVCVAGRFIGDIEFGGATHSTGSDSEQDLFVASLSASGQPNWSRSMNASGDQAMARSIANDSSGNAIVAGHFSSTIDLGAGESSSEGFSFFVVKYAAADGGHIWSRVLETNKSIFGSSLEALPNIKVAIDSADGVVIAADFAGTLDLGISGNGNPTATSRDIVIARFDSAGVLDWHTRLDGTSDELVASLALDSSDNVIVAGSFKAEIKIGATTLIAPSSYRDGFVARLSSLGVAEWAVQVSGSEGASGINDVAVGEDGTVLLAGDFRGVVSITGGGELRSANNIESGLPSRDAFVGKLSSLGELVWIKSFGSGRTDIGQQIDWDGASSYIVSAVVTAEAGETVDVEGTLLDTGEYGDIALIRYASDGSAIHVTRRGSPVTEEPKGMVATDTGVILVGEFMGTLRFGGTYLTNKGGSWTDVKPADIFVTRIDQLP